MELLSKLCPCFQDPEGGRRKTHDEASALTKSTENLAQSSHILPSQTSPAISATFPDQNENVSGLIPVADSTNHINLAPPSSSQNNRELELEKFRQEIDKWKEWKKNHPTRNWIRAVKNIADENSPFLEMLPAGMIPIRGLVKSLVYICKQAAVFALAKEEVFAFMQEIDKWLLIVCAVDSRNGLKDDVWEVLDEIKQLIGDVIRWSSGLQVVSSQWLSDVSFRCQIQAYREGFIEISTRFGVVSDIKLLQGLENTAHGMNTLTQSVDNVADMITENNDNVKRVEFLKQRLQPRLIVNASYNDQNKQPCDPETRVKILEEIMSWINDVSEESQRFYWLSGAPGVGKSAVTASVAKNCQDAKVLGSQFFINRNDAATTDPRALFPTICWQLCERFPRTVAVALEKILYHKPSIIDEISDDQATQLFVKAIEAAGDNNGSRAVVIVIDALDETDPKPLWNLAQILVKVLPDLPRYAKVFISSRTEDAITEPFNSLRDHIRVKFKYVAAKESIEEVSQFMKKKLDEILRRYHVNWVDWGDDRMKKLSSQASGLYIWAETALKFLQTEVDSSGTACIGKLLNMLTANGMDDINQLYSGILQRTCKNRDSDWEYQRFRRIIGAIIVRQAPLSIGDIGKLLILEDPVFSNPVDLVHFVRQYRTVLVNDTRDINDSVVPSMHRSFVDFITSERAREFHIDRCASHGELALQCMEQLGDLVEYLRPDRDPEAQGSFPTQLAYASVHWQTHLTRVVEPDWEEKNAYYDMPDEVSENDAQNLPATPRDIKPHGTAETPKEELFSLAFSPDGTQFALPYGCDVQIRDARTGTVTMSFIGHAVVTSVGFSPDGTQLVSSSWDHKARIWDTQTGKELHVLRGHTHWVYYAAFSHDGRTVVTASFDNTVRTWDSSTGQLLNVFKGHTKPVSYCVFSLNDKRIASRTWGEIMVWDVNSGNLISKLNHKYCRMISFCPCGHHLVSRDRDGETKLWDAESGNQLGHVKSTIASNSLAFMKESEQKSASSYIHIPPALSLSEPVDSSTPHMYYFETKTASVYVIAENGQNVWVSIIGVFRLFSCAGATRIC